MYTKLFSSLFAAMVLSACLGGADDTAGLAPDEPVSSVASEIHNGWIGPFSEEADHDTGVCGSANVGITEAHCSGQYCDNIELYCEDLPDGVTISTSIFDTTWFSEETGHNVNQAFCQTAGAGTAINGVMDGIKVAGQYADSIKLRCSKITTGRLANCGWTGWFSEEDGAMDFGTGRYAVGASCRGQYCDEMRYYTCSMTP